MTDTLHSAETDSRDATAGQPASAPFERTISPIAGRLGRGRGGKLIVFVGLAAGCGVFLVASWGHGTPKAQARADQPARQVVPFEPLRADSGPTLQTPGPDAPIPTRGGAESQVPAIQPSGAASADRQTQLAAIRGAPLIAYSRTRAATGTDEPASLPTPSMVDAAEPATELDELRRGSAIGEARAWRLPDRNFLITAGTVIPCVLQTAMDTATPGYVSCVISHDVFSDNGAVVLMEKGAKVLGEYRSSLRQGRRRLFVLWTRAVTPSGVAISLASPAADALGRAGFDGDLDTHFWDRFGGALLLSVVDGAASPRDGMTRMPSDAAGLALQNSVSIPPSLRKAQGAEVSIFVAQDFDFSGVYGLRAK